MKPALLTRKKLVIAITLAAHAVFVPQVQAAAGGLQVCSPSSSCEVGEFLYDDDYSPILGATCTITSKYPDGSAFVTNQSMTGASDGWYGYQFSAPTTEGMYRTQVCCTSGDDYLCIDKGFEIKTTASGVNAPSADEVAEAVWGFSDRTLSSFGTLVRDIWLNSTRSLTTLSLDSSTNASTGSSASVSQTSLDEIQKTTRENRLLLEELVNKPIIETSLDEDELDLGKKLDETRALANSFYANSEFVRSSAEMIVSKWNSFSDAELQSQLTELAAIIGTQADKKNNSTLIGSVNWFSTSWNWNVTKSLAQKTQELMQTIDSAQIEISTRGRSTYSYTKIKSLSTLVGSMQEFLGDNTSKVTDETLFGKLREVSRIAQVLDQENSRLGDIMVQWQDIPESEVRSSLNAISQSVSPLNRVAQLRGILAPLDSSVSGRDLQNKAYAIGGVIETNRKVLAARSDHAVAATWLELGSIVFKSVIINPSGLISQNAHLKYFLPPEIKEEHIKRIDQGLNLTYDVERDQYFVEGNFALSENETITVSLSVEDIFVISDTEIASIRAQVEELVKPLSGTAYFAQGVTLKSDIDVALNKVEALQNRAVTPEQKIRFYREAMVELSKVSEKVENLKVLVSDVSATSAMHAFIGGAQTFSVWGIVIVIIAACVFLALFMKKLHTETPARKKSTSKHKPQKPESSSVGLGQFNWNEFARSALGLVVFGALVSASTAFVVMRSVTPTSSIAIQEQHAGVGNNVLAETVEAEESSIGGLDIIKINVPDGSSVVVRRESSIESEAVHKLRTSQDGVRLREENGFVLLAITVGERGEDTIEGWVHSEFVTIPDSNAEIVDNQTDSETDQTISPELRVEILETPTGWLRVREVPNGVEIDKVNTGESFTLLDDTASWFKILLPNNREGYISKQFSRVKNI